MYKICRTEQSIARQRLLEQGLLTLMERSRYDELSVSDLCRYMNLPRKAFYRYFSGKDGALYALIDHTIGEFFNLPPSVPRGTAMGDLNLFFAFWQKNSRLLEVLQKNGLSGILVERANNFALNEGLFPRHMKSWHAQQQSMALSFAISGLMSMVFRWHNQGYLLTAREITDLATQLLTQPLLK